MGFNRISNTGEEHHRARQQLRADTSAFYFVWLSEFEVLGWVGQGGGGGRKTDANGIFRANIAQ